MSADFVAVDVEGNGGTPPEIVELAATTFQLGAGIREQRCWLVKPSAPIQWRAKRIHGIGNDDVANCPPLSDVKAAVLDYLNVKIFVSHHASVELSILHRQFDGWEPREIADTLPLSRQLLKEAPSHKLDALVRWLDLTVPEKYAQLGYHRAGYDSAACALLFLKLAGIAEKRGLSVGGLITRRNTQGR